MDLQVIYSCRINSILILSSPINAACCVTSRRLRLAYRRSVDVLSFVSVGCNQDLVMNGPTTENCVKKDEHLCELQMLVFLSAYSLDLYQQLHCSKKNGYLAGQWSPRLFHCECLTLSGDCVLRQSHL